jgi:uncharacterized protein (TIGR00730 family)
MHRLTSEFIEQLEMSAPQSPERRALLEDILDQLIGAASRDHDASSLRVAATALDELLRSSALFEAWRDVPKVAVFGSARTASDHPLYAMARKLSALLAEDGWFTVTGAGPGIMSASAEGAGSDHTLGVNIDLPFEQFPNPHIDIENKLITMQYFFTRKVALTRPSNAFVVFPGGFGTLDEAFEVLTLVHTGKTTPAPIILIDSPNGTFWQHWMAFVTKEVLGGHYIGENDLCLLNVVTSAEEARRTIHRFYNNYVGIRLDSGRVFIEAKRPLPSDVINRLTPVAPVFNAGDGWIQEDPTTVSANFDGRNYVHLRRVIDLINEF